MRLIGTLPEAAVAQRFCDYLLTQQVSCHVEEGADGGWQIWIEHDDQVERGRAELLQFAANPSDPRYAASAEADRLRRQQAQAAARRQKNFRDVRTTMFGRSLQRTAPVTIALVALCVLITLATGWGQNEASAVYQKVVFQMPTAQQLAEWARVAQNPDLDHPAQLSFNAFDNIKRGEVWRLVTPIFLHFSPMHLLFDVIFLWQFGTAIERVKGSGHFLILVLATAVISNALQGAWMVWQDPNAPAMFGGISGVDAGLFGYVWMCGKFRPYEGLGVSQYNIGIILGWLVLCSIGLVGPIANAAHWSGLAVGMAFGAAPSLRRLS